MASEYVLDTLMNSGIDERTARVIMERMHRFGLMEDIESLYLAYKAIKDRLGDIRDPIIGEEMGKIEEDIRKLITDIGKDPFFSKLAHLSLRVEIPLSAVTPYRSRIAGIRERLDSVSYTLSAVEPKEIHEAISEVEMEIEKRESQGIEVGFLKDRINRLKGIAGRGTPYARRYVSAEVKSIKDKLDKLDDIAARRERLISLLPKTKEVCSYLDSISGTDIFSSLFNLMSNRLISLTIASEDELNKVDIDLSNFEDLTNTLLQIYPLFERKVDLFDYLDMVEGYEGLSDVIKGILRDEGLPKELRAAKVIEILKDKIKGIDEFVEARKELRRLYPFWKSYIMEELRNKGYAVKVDELEKIPKRWRYVIARMLSEENEDIIFENGFIVHSRAYSDEILRKEMERIKEELEIIRGILSGLEKLGVNVSDKISEIGQIELKMEEISAGKPEVKSVAEIKQARKLINELKDWIISKFAS
ncbi:MAG: hypothetical protein ACP5KE_02190 [Candidatus Methanodesulfokora sp.]|nr:MAG: hypothetical protein C0200_00205 [Candidatus Korarchaeota archaeon]